MKAVDRIVNAIRTSASSLRWNDRTELPIASTFVFFHTNGTWSSAETLAFVDAEDYVRDDDGRTLFLSGWLGVYDDGQWLQLIDGYDYKICSRRNISQKFMDISRRFDVFFFSLPDHDMSLNYAMYQHGQCVRSVWISSPKFTDQVIEKNTGELLRGEEQVIFGKDGQFLLDGGDSYKLSLLAIAEEMGANTNYTKSTFSFYRQSNSRSLNK